MESKNINEDDLKMTEGVNLVPVKRHLDSVPDSYFELINKGDEMEFISFMKKLEPLKMFVKNPRLVVSVGVGGGLELRVLSELFKD